MSLTAIILAAGRGSRLRPLTDTVPKVLVEVQGKPVVEYIVHELLQHGVSRLLFVTGHLGYKIEEYFSGHPNSVDWLFIEQSTLDGTGGAVRVAREHVSDEYLVVFGDSFFAPGSLARLIATEASDAICVVPVPDPQRYGIIVYDEAYVIQDIEEKPHFPKSNLAIAGAYKFSYASLKYFDDLTLSTRGEYEIPDAIRAMMRDGISISAVPIDGMVDIGTIEQLLAVNSENFSFEQ